MEKSILYPIDLRHAMDKVKKKKIDLIENVDPSVGQASWYILYLSLSN